MWPVSRSRSTVFLGTRIASQPAMATRVRLRNHRNILIAVAIWLGALGVVSGQLQHPSRLRNHPAIGYATVPTRDPISELNRKLKAGEITLEAQGESGTCARCSTR